MGNSDRYTARYIGSTGKAHTYDANGNTLAPSASAGVIIHEENGLTYIQTFDIENRLLCVTAGGQTTQFIYGARFYSPKIG